MQLFGDLDIFSFVRISWLNRLVMLKAWMVQGESLARGPKLLSIRNYVIQIMT